MKGRKDGRERKGREGGRESRMFASHTADPGFVPSSSYVRPNPAESEQSQSRRRGGREEEEKEKGRKKGPSPHRLSSPRPPEITLCLSPHLPGLLQAQL